MNLGATGAGAHNNIYRGKNLGTSVTDAQYAAIADGTFTDLYIGDYWTISDVTYLIGGFDYWLQCGDTAFTKHHIVAVPLNSMYTYAMNSSNTTSGAYVGSNMYKNGLTSAKTTINAAFSGHVGTHREYFTNAISGDTPSAGNWYDSTVDLMNGPMVYGSYIFMNAINGTTWPYRYTISKSQLPLFRYRPDLIMDPSRRSYWLRDVCSSTDFTDVYGNGRANTAGASAVIGVRPAFAIV
jgi:hypothetical protein